jgi:flagellar export protein FliJ
MAFRFTLQPVLRYRQTLEERERLTLQSLLGKRTALLQALQQAQEMRRQLQIAMQRAMQEAPTAAIELHVSLARLNGIACQQELLRSCLALLEEEVARQTARYRAERQKREMLESLRDSQLREYRVKQQRHEQAALDELHLLTRMRANRPNLPT